jgi:diguanylate cyclase (GGDEF)-like protein/PAS domain S-box-containing protein
VSDPSLATVVAAIALDGAGAIVSCDAGTERVSGHPPAQLSGRPLADLVAPEDRPRLREGLGAMNGAGPRRIELALVHRDGHRLPCELTMVALAPFGATGTMVTLHDLTEQRRAEQAAVVAQLVTAAMTRAHSPEQALQSLLRALAQRLGWSGGTYWTIEGGDDLRAVVAWPGEPTPDARPQPLTERVLQLGAASWEPGRGGATGLAAPVRREDRVVGVLELLGGPAREPDPAFTEALTGAAAQIGELLGGLEERLTLMASLTRLALTDGLTGLPNRRAWEDALSRELARARRSGLPVCIAVLDLDDFKAFNDEHGHQAGDAILAETARVWQEQLRATDVLARYGGEEFAAVIPAWPLEQAVEVVERLRRATPGGLTASAGVASWDGTESGSALFGRADAALYEAKQAGRDRTLAAA